MTKGRLYISFWHICLNNLPEGTFTRRSITPESAKGCIEQARQEQRLRCVSDQDLWLLIMKMSRKHASLCDVLAKHYGISLSHENFLSDFGGDGLYCTNPLVCMEVQGNERLLVVTCSFTWPKKRKRGELNLEIDPTTVEFHMFEAQDNPKVIKRRRSSAPRVRKSAGTNTKPHSRP